MVYIRFENAATYYEELEHQIKAWNDLEGELTYTQLNTFSQLFRNVSLIDSPVKLTNAAKYYINLPHQVRAWEYLQGSVSKTQLLDFQLTYRRKPSSEFSAESPITQRVLNRILELGLPIDRNKSYILGIEGVNTDLSYNDDRLDKWNDALGVMRVTNTGMCRIRGFYRGTTESGRRYVVNPLNSKGAAFALTDTLHKDIWVKGMHRSQPNCLIQTGNEITVRRDSNRDGKRGSNEPLDTGYFGLNFHRSNNGNPNTIGKYSAGCTVTLKDIDHRAMMDYLYPQAKYSYILLDGTRI